MMEQLLHQLISWAKNQSPILALYLYGSQAKEQAHALSDVDIAILLDPHLSKQELWVLEKSYMSQWPECLDIRLLNLTPLTFRYEVMTTGQRLWVSEINRVAESESLTWREYWDFQPKLDQYWSAYLQQIMESKNETERQQYQATVAKIRTIRQRVKATAINQAAKV